MSQTAPAPIQAWHAYMKDPGPDRLGAQLAEDVVFESPVVHTPQAGKEITTLYLLAAAQVLGVPSFRYREAWYGEASAVLEFECVVEGIVINGVDIIHWNAEGLIDRFKVMVRPLKAINLLHQLMGARLAKPA
jgi:hypothetical protein